MPHPTLLLLLLSLGSPLLLPAGAATVLYVKPTEETPCPGEPCHTLDEYAQNSTQYFVSDATMKFLRGTHILNWPLNIHGINNLFLTARNATGNETIVQLSKPLWFTNVSNLTFVDCDFSNSNGSVVLNASHNVAFIHCHFSGRYMYATVHLVTSHNVTFIDCTFSLNSDVNKSVWLEFSHDITFIDCNFSENKAISTVVWMNASHHVTFIGCNFSANTCSHQIYTLGVVYLLNSYNVPFINCSFSENNDLHGIVNLYHSRNGTFINCTFTENEIISIDVYRPYVAYGIMLLDISYNVIFANCSFYANTGSSIWAYNSNFTLSGTIVFSNNAAYEGGALAFYGESSVYIANNTDVTLLNNTAENVGGAIFVRNPLPYVTHSCFLQFQYRTSSQDIGCRSLPQCNINFINNTAKKGGNAIYGAYMYGCILDVPHCFKLDPLIRDSHYLHFDPSLESDLSVISSDPTRVCLCEDGKPNCTLTFNNGSNYKHYPGEEFFISAAVVGDMFGTVAGSAYAQILSPSNAKVGDLQQSQQTKSYKCTKLKYSLLSEPGLVEMAFTAGNIPVQNYSSDPTILQYEVGYANYEFLTTPVYINFTLLPCPLGFMLAATQHPQCICDYLLHSHDITCNITDQTVCRRGSVWVSSEQNRNKLIVCNHCPYGYCKTGDVNVSLSDPDTQCTFNHSGRVCGGCQSGLSLAIGSPECLDCSNNYHLALLILFVFLGLALVVFIKVLNLTVAEGTINGLIFYANIVQANQAVFFPTGSAGEIHPLSVLLKVFIAWLNLDFGITTCFYDGLDGYWKTWLQFAFPLYLWAITLLIVYLSHKFQSVAIVFGNNSVPVLATLIFLSYTKLLRTIIIVLSFSFLEVSGKSTVTVWSFDGNIEYLSGKHTPLFVVALAVLLFLWLPYTTLLLFDQCFQKISNYRVRRWMVRFKPFFDAYFGPFRGEHRYWVGVLLAARAVLLVVFGLNSTNEPSVNLLAIIIVAVLLLIHLPYDTHAMVHPNGTGKCRFWGGSYYRKRFLSLLESSFTFNLAMLAVGSFYVLSAKGDQAAATYTSTGITFLQFFAITIFHGYKKFCVSEPQNINHADYEPIPDQPESLNVDQWPPYRPMNECREPLLEDYNN